MYNFEDDFEEISSSRNNIHSSIVNDVNDELTILANEIYEEEKAMYLEMGVSKDQAIELIKETLNSEYGNQEHIEEINLDFSEDNNVPNEAENNEEVVEKINKDDVLGLLSDDDIKVIFGEDKTRDNLTNEELKNYIEEQKAQESYENILNGLNADGSDRNNNQDNDYDLVPEGDVQMSEVNEESIYLEEAESNARVEEVGDYLEERNNENNEDYEDSIDFDNIPVHENLSDRVQGDWTRLIVRRENDRNNRQFNQGNNINYIQ